MCLVVFAWKVHPEHRLVLAANRDEHHGRPAREMHWWPDNPGLLAGRDLQAGGTWLGMHRSGRFATVTNYREEQTRQSSLASRGEIVTEFVVGGDTPGGFVDSIDGGRFAGFSLLVSDGEEICYVSNRGDGPVTLEPGIYGLSNAALDTPWFKVVKTRESLKKLVEEDAVSETTLMRLVSDRTVAPATDMEAGVLPFEMARAVTAPFIVSSEYGTRCSTVLTWSNSGTAAIAERRFGPGGTALGDARFLFETR